jgi:hypothetical protein
MNATRRALLASLLIALSVAAGQALAGVPNVELITFFVFLAGFLLGARTGAFVGGASMGAHSLFNVMGTVVPPVLITQVVVYMLIGAAGSLLGRPISRRAAGRATLLAAACGGGLTLFYQLVVNATAWFTFSSGNSLWVFVWGGVAFGAVHVAWNCAAFGVALRPTMSVLDRFRGELNEAA